MVAEDTVSESLPVRWRGVFDVEFHVDSSSGSSCSGSLDRTFSAFIESGCAMVPLHAMNIVAVDVVLTLSVVDVVVVVVGSDALELSVGFSSGDFLATEFKLIRR